MNNYEDHLKAYKMEVAKLYKTKGCKEISKMLGISKTTVLSWLRELGETTRIQGHHIASDNQETAIQWKAILSSLEIDEYATIERKLLKWHKGKASVMAKKLNMKVKSLPINGQDAFIILRTR